MKKVLLATLFGIFGATATAGAQDYPSRAINLIVPNPPGGMNQIHAQPLGAIIEKLYKQPAPVLNKPGATAAAGTGFVANAAPDGYNVLVTTPNIYLAVEKDKLFGIDSPYKLEQLAPIALLSADPLALSVQTENPVKAYFRPSTKIMTEVENVIKMTLCHHTREQLVSMGFGQY